MASLNGTSILYGVARGIISQISANTILGKMILPTINFIEYFCLKHNEQIVEDEKKQINEKVKKTKNNAGKRKKLA